MAKKINHIKPSFIEGGEVWHDIDKFPMLDHTILVELLEKGSDVLIYQTQNVCIERDEYWRNLCISHGTEIYAGT